MTHPDHGRNLKLQGPTAKFQGKKFGSRRWNLIPALAGDRLSRMSLYRRFKNWKDIRRWEAKGRPSPPPHAIKQRVLREFKDRYGLEILVETGTFKGDMMEAMKYDFRQLYSIELAAHFYERAMQRFINERHIEILQGDSGKVLESLVPKLDGPTLFWLDGHYSKGDTARGDDDTPIMQELGHIFSRADLKSVILIDDARCFMGQTEQVYPAIESVREFVAKHRPDLGFEVDTDCIRLAPKS